MYVVRQRVIGDLDEEVSLLPEHLYQTVLRQEPPAVNWSIQSSS